MILFYFPHKYFALDLQFGHWVFGEFEDDGCVEDDFLGDISRKMNFILFYPDE